MYEYSIGNSNIRLFYEHGKLIETRLISEGFNLSVYQRNFI